MPQGVSMVREFGKVALVILLTARCSSADEPGVGSPQDVKNTPPATSSTANEPSNNAKDAAASQDNSVAKELTPALLSLFERLDKLGRDKIKGADIVTINFTDAERPQGKSAENAWLLSR